MLILQNLQIPPHCNTQLLINNCTTAIIPSNFSRFISVSIRSRMQKCLVIPMQCNLRNVLAKYSRFFLKQPEFFGRNARLKVQVNCRVLIRDWHKVRKKNMHQRYDVRFSLSTCLQSITAGKC